LPPSEKILGSGPQRMGPRSQSAAASIFPLAAGTARVADHASLWLVSAGSALLLLLLAAAALIYRSRLSGSPSASAETWGCGYLAPNPRMQYTASSFAAILTSLFSGILRSHSRHPEIKGYFPKKSSFRSHVPEALLEGVYLPLFNSSNSRLSLVRKLQNGKLYLYILYIVVTLVALLTWSHFRTRS